jgi:Big-like domain-containing protein
MRRSRFVLLLVAMALAIAAAFGAPIASASGVAYAVGDVFAGDSNGLIKHFSPTGVLLDTLNTQSNSFEDTGMCFGESGNLRSTNFTANNMTLFDNMGNVLTFPWAGPFSQHPESCVLDATGNIYVGQADGSRDVLKLSPGGTLLASFNVATGPRGSDWIDLAADQCTLYYTSEGNTIRRFDVCGNAQLPDFATGFTDPGSSTVCYALRIRPNGEVMVACTDKIYRLSAAGTVIQRYPLPAGETSFLFAMNLDPDNATFWTAGFNSGNIYRINIDTGALVTQFAAGSAVKGLAIFGEITVARPPASLTLVPKTATNPVGTQHCVTATVKDATGHTLQGVTVQFSVTGTAGNTASGSVDTDVTGQAQFCYQGPTTPGNDTIKAYADSNKNGVQDAGEPFDVAAKTWVPGPPATLTLAPKTATNTVDSQHCVTATVKDQFGNPTPSITVRFSVTGSVTTSGSSPTNASGQATFCYIGPSLPGSDVITAFADTNDNGVQDAGEPSDTATKAWVLPTSTPACKVTYGGRITAANGDKGTFGGNAMVPAPGPRGEEEYQDHGTPTLNVHSIDVLAVTCSADGTSASIFGTATINGSGSFNYRIDVTDNGEPGAGTDTYRIRLSTGYDSGEQTLVGGNVQIH